MTCNARPAIDRAAIDSPKLTGIASARQINEALFGRSVIFIEHNISKYGDLGTFMFAIPSCARLKGSFSRRDQNPADDRLGSYPMTELGYERRGGRRKAPEAWRGRK